MKPSPIANAETSAVCNAGVVTCFRIQVENSYPGVIVVRGETTTSHPCLINACKILHDNCKK